MLLSSWYPPGSWSLWHQDFCFWHSFLLVCLFFLHFFVFHWFLEEPGSKKKKKLNELIAAWRKEDVCFCEVLPETVVNYNFFLINKPLWSHWPAPVEGTVRDQTVWVVSTHILCSACNETDCLEWNPISVSVWPDSPRHALRVLQRKWMYHQSIDFYSVWSSFCLLIVILSEPSARCGMKLAWASHQTGCDYVT